MPATIIKRYVERFLDGSQRGANILTRNLTTGSPMRLILQFAVPTLLGLLFQQCYNLVDTMIVGKI